MTEFFGQELAYVFLCGLAFLLLTALCAGMLRSLSGSFYRPWLASVEDTAERKRAEEALRVSQTKYKSLYDSSSDAIMLLTLERGFFSGNPATVAMFGCRDEHEFTTCTPADLSPERQPDGELSSSKAASMMLRALETGSHFFEWTHRRVDGSVFPATVLLTRMELEGKQVLQATVRDITCQKRMEDDLRRVKDAAEAATRAKSRFLATMSHEIRTPMTAILGYTDLLLDPMTDNASRNSYLATIRRSGEHLLHLINDILDLSKIEAGKLTLDLGPCSLVAVIADVASMMRPRAGQRNNTLAVEYVGDMPETICGDAARLRQALVNLVGNALKFTENGSVRIRAAFLPDWEGQPAVRIEVIDAGIGIAGDVLPLLFQPFTQGDSTTCRRFGGTGLGLAISHHIAELLGGRLTATSRLGQGSVFTLTLPTGDLEGVRMLASPVEASLEAAPQHPASAMAGNLDGMRILLAEDGFDNQQLIGTVLRRAGAEVAIAENGRIAVEQALATPFDLILMDMNMPEMDGYAATRLLRDRGYRQPILALTASVLAEDIVHSLEAGCDEHLTKPIDRPKLIQAIARHVNESRVPHDGAAASGHEIRKVEVQMIQSQFSDDPEIMPLLDGFVARLEGQVREMRQSLANASYEDLHRSAHKMKGSGGSYGYPSLTEACVELELAAKAQDAAAAAVHLDRVATLCDAIAEGRKACVCG